MFLASSGLPHLLPPRAYRDPAILQDERRGVIDAGWHLAATIDQLKDSGDFVTLTLLGHEIQIRNFEGQLKAYSNICAHRHCLLTNLPRGNSPVMRCQYHGWEYGSDGATRKIPCAKDLAPIERDRWRLPEYRVASCGRLVFVAIHPSAPSLEEFLGPMLELIHTRFGEGWEPFYRGVFEYEANWKIAIENSLEAYHVESVHPATFRQSPGESRSEHRLNDRHTAFVTDMPFAVHHRSDRWFQSIESWFVRRLGGTIEHRYQQHHLFPNLLFSFTDAISLVHYVEPLGAQRSRSTLVQFGVAPPRPNRLQKVLARILGTIEGKVLDRIFREDLSIYPSIQRGLNGSQHAGRLARSEERIHAFQSYLTQQKKNIYDDFSR